MKTAVFFVAMARIAWALLYGTILERFGGVQGERRSWIIQYKALKRMVPAMKSFHQVGIHGRMEADVENHELRTFIRNCRRQVLALH